jgi:hypothetical protein
VPQFSLQNIHYRTLEYFQRGWQFLVYEYPSSIASLVEVISMALLALSPPSNDLLRTVSGTKRMAKVSPNRLLGLRAFFQYTCSVEWRARWLFLEEKATWHPAFALHQLEKCFKSVHCPIAPQTPIRCGDG